MPPHTRSFSHEVDYNYNAAKVSSIERISPHAKSLKMVSEPNAPRAAPGRNNFQAASHRYIAEPVCYTIREQKVHSRLLERARSNSQSSDTSDDESSVEEELRRKFVMYGIKITFPNANPNPGDEKNDYPKTIFRRYQDFEELNNMLPSDVAYMAKLPGRRLWARLTGSRFSQRTLQQRHSAVVGYLQRVLDMVPEIGVVQMFISDDWLSRDTPSRKRQFARLRLQQRRLEMLMSERSAEVARFKSYVNPGASNNDVDSDSSSQSDVDPDSALGRRLARLNRTRHPSPLNPAADPLRGEETKTEDRDSAFPTPIKKQGLPIAREIPRVRELRLAQSDPEDQDDVIVLAGGTSRGTPRVAQFESLPRSPLPPKER